MKKKFLSLMFVLSLLTLGFLYLYTETNFIQSSYDYYTSELIAYIFWWFSALFVLGLVGLLVRDYLYKIWIGASIVVASLSLIFAYINRRGGGGILSFDGELITFIMIGLHSFISLVYFVVQYFKSR